MQHGKKTPSARRHLLSRRWARSAALVAVVAAGGLGTGALVTEDEAAPRRTEARPDVVAVAPTAPRAPGPARYEPPKAARSAEPARRSQPPAGRPHQAPPRTALKGDPAERVRALRELELRDPAAAARTAIDLVQDPADLVRVNAVALLTRSHAPEAARALAALDPESKRLADALKARK